jgi:stress response protein YsnF
VASVASGKTKAEYEQNMNEMQQQWETTFREQQEQLAKAQDEIDVIHVAACDHPMYADVMTEDPCPAAAT